MIVCKNTVAKKTFFLILSIILLPGVIQTFLEGIKFMVLSKRICVNQF